MNVLFAGTPEFAVAPLAAICAEHSVVGVLTQPDRKAGRGKKLTPPPVKVFALENDIPVYQPESLKNQAELISSLNADVMVVVAYGMLLPQTILDIPPLGCINIHASLLPRWRGAAPIQRAIEAGDSQTGVSIMRMELGLDTGPVFETLTTAIDANDTSASLHDKLASLGAEGIRNTLNALAEDPELTAVTQDHSQANYAKKISKTEAVIDWSQSSEQIDQRIRAFVPWPVCQSQHQQTRIRVWRASPQTGVQTDATPGTVINASDDGIDVACGVGVLRLQTLQRDGSKPITAGEFLNGYQLVIGDRLS